jgi:hypothetical protein
MQNYQLIKGYLETLPSDMTISNALQNIISAEETLKLSKNELENELKNNVGKCYCYIENDDYKGIAKYYVKIVGVGTSYNVYYICNLIQITEDAIYFEENQTITQKELLTAIQVDENVYDVLYDKFNQLLKFNHEV